MDDRAGLGHAKHRSGDPLQPSAPGMAVPPGRTPGVRRSRLAGPAGWIVVAALAILLTPAIRHFGRPASASATILGIGRTNGALRMSVVVTNTGPTTLCHYGFPPESEIWVVGPSGRSRVPQIQLSRRSALGFLLPGRSLFYDFEIPPGVSRVQACCHFTIAGTRASAAARLMDAGLWNPGYRLWEIVLPLLPEGSEDPVEVWTQEWAVP